VILSNYNAVSLLCVRSQSIKYVKHLTVNYDTELGTLAKRYRISARTPAMTLYNSVVCESDKPIISLPGLWRQHYLMSHRCTCTGPTSSQHYLMSHRCTCTGPTSSQHFHDTPVHLYRPHVIAALKSSEPHLTPVNVPSSLDFPPFSVFFSSLITNTAYVLFRHKWLYIHSCFVFNHSYAVNA
jgi:hypothetical protein